MLNFKTYLKEDKSDKNLHLVHLQDQVFTDGVDGVKGSINFLTSLRDMLSEGGSKSKVNVSIKIDGAPAVICGINPDNGKFFVGTKGVFAQNAKLNYTNGDIDRNYPTSGVASKLKTALEYLPDLGITNVIQGDMMFTQEDLKTETIDSEKMITFQPNTIVYAVPTNTTLAQQIKQAKLGIVFHTSYHGNKLADMKASFGVDISRLKHTRDVWFKDSSWQDVSGTATLTDDERKQLDSKLTQIGALFRTIPAALINQIASNETYRTDLMAWNNSKVREGTEITDTVAHTRGFIVSLEKKLNQSIIDSKKSDTKDKRIKEKNIVLGFFKQHSGDLKKIFDLQNLIVDAKLLIVKKLQQITDIGTFLKTDNGFKVTNPEGFVCVDSIKGNAVKLINQLEFSHANFTTTKNWTT